MRAVFVAGLLSGLAGCTDAPPLTQVMVVIEAEPAAAARIAAVTVAIVGRGGSESTYGPAQEERFMPSAGDWPIEIGLVPAEQDASRTYRIEATAFDGGEAPLTVVRAMGGYRKGVVSMLTMTFDADCIDRRVLCPDDLTCETGVCASADVNDRDLSDYADDLDEPDDGATDAAVTDVSPDAVAGQPDAAVSLDPCAVDNGGCDVDMRCQSAMGMVECTPCPSASQGMDGRCGLGLVGLEISAGRLEPAFSPEHTDYVVRLPLLMRRLTVIPTAPAGAQVAIGQRDLGSGQPWESPALSYGETPLEIRVTDAAGTTTVYGLLVARRGTEAAYLKASNAGYQDNFGRLVAASGDTLVVGALYEDSAATGVQGDAEDNSSPDSGAAYVFERAADGSFVQTAYLKPSDTVADGFFATSLAIDESTLLVGSVGGNGGGLLGVGAVYVFVRDEGGWRQQAKLVPEDGESGDWFGVAVGIDGDRAVIGAPDRTVGAVYVYERAGERWSLVQRFTQDDPLPSSRFGAALELSGDRLLIGAPTESSAVPEGGAAYVFERGADGRFAQVQTLRPGTPGNADWFGYAISGNDDFIAVGAPQQNSAAWHAGAVYIFGRGPDGFRERQRLMPNSNRQNAWLGSSVHMRPNGLLFAGAEGEADRGQGFLPPQDNGGAPASGGVYMFGLQGEAFVLDAYFKPSNSGTGDSFGYDLAATDGLLIVGAQHESSSSRQVDGDRDNNDLQSAGAAYVFE